MESLLAKIKNIKGQTLVELLIAIGLSAILIPALLAGFSATRNGRAQSEQRIVAMGYLNEVQEAVRIVDANNWDNLIDGVYHPVISGSTWALSLGSESIGGFVRQIVIADVYRNSSGDIVSSGGTIDPSTKQIAISVSWSTPLASSVSTSSYLTRHKNLSLIYTTVTDFSSGTLDSTTVTQTLGTGIPNDGQVQLGSGGGANGGDWCQPASSVLATYDLPGQGVVQSLSSTSSASQNVAYTTTGGNASGDAVDGLSITYANPPVITNPNFNNEAKAYGIFVDQVGGYVYFNENNPPNHTVRITNAGNLVDVGYFDVNGGTGNSVYVLGNVGYTTVGSKLYSFDISSKTGSRPQLGSVSLAATGKRVFVVGTNAYVVTTSTTSQLQIINASNPSSLSLSKSINLGNGLAGVDVFVDNTQSYAYVATTYASGKNDFFIVDLQNTSNIYGYSTNGMSPKGIIVVPRNRAILVGSGGTLYQVFDTTRVNSATYCGGMSPAGVTSVNAVSYVIQSDGRVFAYILTDNASQEFQVVLGGPGGGQFASTGTYTSTPFDALTNSFFNRFSASISQPNQTNISVQVAVAQAVSNSCSSALYTFVGPTGTSSYFNAVGSTISGQIPFSATGNYVNPGRCFKYKVFFTSNDSTLTPILDDMTINYSP